jgi:hypothetical protein
VALAPLWVIAILSIKPKAKHNIFNKKIGELSSFKEEYPQGEADTIISLSITPAAESAKALLALLLSPN